ncbi:MAG: hypothetical protein GTN64_02440 [Candidatus Latescibacteria bacterium]|nr:hypothetical protein [Candidatus Latescibacterota bacterium]NIO77476.1 hypothetical protein [Candidatus Latescibacterota bacterium]
MATTPDTNIYTHNFTVKDDLPSYNIEINRGDVPTDGKVFRYDGVMFDQYAFEWAGERQAQHTFTTVNKDRATNVDESGTQTYPGDYPLLFHHLATVTIAAETTLAAKVKAMSLFMNNNLQKDNYFNSRFKAKSKRDGDRTVNGTALFEFEDLNLMNKLVSGVEGTFTLKLTSDLDIPSSSPPTKFSLEFSGDASFISKADSDIADKSPIELPVSFELLGAAEITAQLINGEVSY